MSDRQARLGTLLRSAPPDRLPEVAADHLRQRFAADDVEVLFCDLTLTTLCPLLDPAAPGADLVAMRCLGSQQRMVTAGAGGATRIHLPLTCWGDRLGVLRVTLPQSPAVDILDQLGAITDELAQAISAAGPRTDRYRRAQRRERLTMAAELQWELLPGRSLGDERFLVAGQLEPAYAVHGDHFDWTVHDDCLTLTVLNGHGDGMEAAVLTALAVNAMRNARRSGANIVEQAELASDALYARYGGAAHAATLLIEFDLIGGWVEVVDAGSPRCMLVRGGQIDHVALEQQLPLGMFGAAHYETQRFRLEPGDRLLVISDGVHAATPGGRPSFGESALLNAVRRTRLQPATEAVGTIIQGLRDYHGDVEAEDDAVTVCLDWRR